MKEFINEFKHLEKLCNEVYAQQHGVTQYIDEMTQKSRIASGVIYGWDSDLAKLKRVRHIRNNLVHESNYDIDYDNSDIAFIRDFYNRILNQQDPLALLRRQTERIAQTKHRPRGATAAYQSSSPRIQPEQIAQIKNRSHEVSTTHQSPSNGRHRKKGNAGKFFIKCLLIGLAAILIRLLWFFVKLISEAAQ